MTPPCHRGIREPVVTRVPVLLFGVVSFRGALVEVTGRLLAKRLREGERERKKFGTRNTAQCEKGRAALGAFCILDCPPSPS